MRHLFILTLSLGVCLPAAQDAFARAKTTPCASSRRAKKATPHDTAEIHWAKRDNQEELEKALAIYKELAEKDSKDSKSLTRLARGYYLLGDGHYRKAGKSLDEMKALWKIGWGYGMEAVYALSPEFKKEIDAGKKHEEVINLVPNKANAALYWYAVNLGKWAKAKDFTTLLFYKSHIYAVMNRVLEIDEKYLHGAAHRYFGAYYALAPGFAGGSPTKSREHFTSALKISPDYLGTKVLMADTLFRKTEDRENFHRVLLEVKASNISLPGLAPEFAIEKFKAGLLLEEEEDIFGFGDDDDDDWDDDE